MDLFLQPNLEFEKVAAGVEMPEDPNAWPQEVLQQLFKQAPFLSDFAPNVTMDKVDAEKGYGFGHVTITQKTEIQQASGGMPPGAAAAGMREIRIPIVIKQNKLSPLDLLVSDDSKMMPLTESRLRQSIFRPQAFDVTGKTPGDQSMIGQLYPPYRQNFGFGGGGAAMGVGMGKESSALEQFLSDDGETKKMHPGDEQHGVFVQTEKRASVLEAIAPTISETDLARFHDALGDESVKLAYEKNAAATIGALKTLLDCEPTKLAEMETFVRPTVVQVIRMDEGYTVKTANHHYWSPQTMYLSRGDAIQQLGEKIVLAADTAGAVTAAEGADAAEEAPMPGQAPAPEGPDSDMQGMGPVTEFGLYKVQTDDGQEIVGYVVPNLIDIDGKQVPLALFTNGSVATVQGEIMGTPVQAGASELPTADEPSGYGCFFSQGPEGVQATIPMEISGSFQGPEGPGGHQATTFDGRSVEVSQQPNIQAPMPMEGKLLVPEHWQWVPLNQADSVSLVGGEDEAPKEASAKRYFASVELLSGGSTFSLRGHAVEKLASIDREFINVDQAMFILAGLGVDQTYGIQKLGEATSGRAPVQVKIGRYIKTASEMKKAASARAQAYMSHMPMLKRSLFKEAAVISDPAAVDAVLSLGFLSSENVQAFIGYLPELDGGQNKLCELLLASRLGLSNVAEGALETSVRAMEEVLEGLKTVAFEGTERPN